MLITEEDIYHTSKILDFVTENQEALSFRRHTIKKGEAIFKQGQAIRDIIFVTDGSISLYRSSVHGRRYQLGTFTHNGFLGLMELFSGNDCFYAVQAESDCDVYMVDGVAFADMICHTPKLAAHTFKHLTSKWYLSIERMTRNILHTMSYCVIDDLLNFANANPKEEYIINKSLECERLGTSLRVYNRILKQLSNIGAISVSRKSIRILDIAKLEAELGKEAEK
ncbi:Crp/Fnr family transcriptional regulator [Vibrio sp. VB16]|uniref:Crp/Fnr family transcriptional regulator n=1 Tax=Vibrio sp. VB16 TaxID=2785746 RepID=UPI00189FBE5B|nr:Crp/Fnr family transcriptional regulator [Vibrio sp. VB16]UGA56931.1 Crp/Fnr family transcriptional regulator [Vibrio sp. VB16]